MTSDKHIDLAKDQLTRVLGFFPRLDSKMSVVLAIDTSMLAVLASRAPTFMQMTWYSGTIATLAVILLAISLWYLYRGGAPELKGGNQSLVYFREIAARREAQFIDEFLIIDEPSYAKDLLSQVWRNSEILAAKFSHLNSSLRFLAAAILPWLIAIALFSSHAITTTP